MVGIDAGSLTHRLTGPGVYLARTLAAMCELPQHSSYHLYCARRPRNVQLAAHVAVHHGRGLIPGTFWLQRNARRFAHEHRLSAFWCPAGVVPLSLPEGVRTVLNVHDLVSLSYPASMDDYNRLVHRLYLRRSVKRADVVLALSKATRDEIICRLGVSEEKVEVVYPGVDGCFQPIARNSARVRLDRIGVPNTYMLAVGTVEPRKNYDLLFRALRLLPGAPPLVLVGKNGWKHHRTLGLIGSLGLEGRVVRLGFVSDQELASLYSGAEMLVFPSAYEGFGLPLLQAMACGTAIVASRRASIPEVAGEAAVYFDVDRVESLADAINSVLGNSNKRLELGEAGLRRAVAFSWTRTAQRVHQLLTGINCPLRDSS